MKVPGGRLSPAAPTFGAAHRPTCMSSRNMCRMIASRRTVAASSCITTDRPGRRYSASPTAFGNVWGTSSTDVYATATPRDISNPTGRSGTTTGTAGRPMAIPATPLWSIWASSSRDMYVLADDQESFNRSGNIWHFDGAEWTEIKTSATELMDIWGSSASDIFAVGADGTILHGP